MPYHYNPVISNELKNFVQAKNWNDLILYLSKLSHSGFRTSCNIFSEEILTTLCSSDYWECFWAIVKTNTKAFLQTFLKAAVNNYKKGTLSVFDSNFQLFGKWVTEGNTIIDKKKVLQAFLPILKSTKEIEFLFATFYVEDIHQRISYLIREESLRCYYELFQCFRKIDYDPKSLTIYCHQLIEKGTNKSFNLVSIMKCYFDLPDVRGQFSLHLNSYELSRLDSSFEDFTKILCSI